MKSRDGWLLVALGVLFLASRRERKGSDPMTLQPNQFAPSVRFWEVPLVEAGSEAVAPIAFLLSWLRIESGGNENAMGSPIPSLGWTSDGQPSEVSIWQLDPGNRRTAGGFTAAELRSMPSVPGNKPATEAFRTAPLSSAFVAKQIAAGLNYIRDARRQVDASLSLNGVPWLFPSVDYLRAVKSIHGSTMVVSDGIPLAVRKLGRAPKSFAELATVLRANRSGLPLLNVQFPNGRTMLDAVLDNAIETAT